MINSIRRLLIRIGKVLPFFVCFLVWFNYAESLFALIDDRFLQYDDFLILNTPISFFIGSYFEYNLQMLFVLFVISISVETCIYNKLACIYLGVNLVEKSYFDFELEPTAIYIICTLNIIVAGYLTFRGLKILLTK
jgi:hypothetical protein